MTPSGLTKALTETQREAHTHTHTHTHTHMHTNTHTHTHTKARSSPAVSCAAFRYLLLQNPVQIILVPSFFLLSKHVLITILRYVLGRKYLQRPLSTLDKTMFDLEGEKRASQID